MRRSHYLVVTLVWLLLDFSSLFAQDLPNKQLEDVDDVIRKEVPFIVSTVATIVINDLAANVYKVIFRDINYEYSSHNVYNEI